MPLPGESVAAVDLGPARDARAQVVAAELWLRCSSARGRWMGSGRGPTRLISPRSTFQSSGSSSRLVERREFPPGGEPLCVAATSPVRIVRNFRMDKGVLRFNAGSYAVERRWALPMGDEL